jgi:hypothetical protein
VRTTISLLAFAAALPLTACMSEDTDLGERDDAPIAAEPDEPAPSAPAAEPTAPPAIAAEPTYFYVRRDLRECAAPACGGYFVTPVNGDPLDCRDGNGNECYIATLDSDVPGVPEPDPTQLREPGDVIVAGTISSQEHPGVGPYGHLNVFEVWAAGAAAGDPRGTGVKVQLNGVMCIVAPCPDKSELVLNTNELESISDLDFAPSGATESEIAIAVAALDGTGPGLIVVGDRYIVEGATGAVANGRTVTQFYTPIAPAAAPSELPLVTDDACVAAGAKIRTDLGDGTVSCLAGEKAIARVTFGTEGGLCCLPGS